MSKPANQKPYYHTHFTTGFEDEDVRIAFKELSRIKKERAAKNRLDPDTLQTKRDATKIRRKEFNQKRSQLLLSMFAAGKQYKCSYQGCDSKENLHIDHILPLSKGGTDEIKNLQFLCGKHNSIKGTKVSN